ncbi:Hypothetical protein HVR_LOCUS1063 [uncultured virus]|nr:Hypothetical protein HVR_LOCUS1063 [uncultured virus]
MENKKIYVVNHSDKEYIEFSGPLTPGKMATFLSLFNILMLGGWYYDANNFCIGYNPTPTHNDKVIVSLEVDKSYKLVQWSDVFDCAEPDDSDSAIRPSGDYYIRKTCDIDSPRDY